MNFQFVEYRLIGCEVEFMNISKKMLISLIGVAVGVIFIISWLFLTIQNESEKNRAAQIISYGQFCMADVVSSSSIHINETRRYDGDTYSWVYVSYTVDGVRYNNVYAGTTKWKVSEGDQIMIYYNPSNPQECVASIYGFGFYTQSYSYLFMVGVVIICIVILPPIFLKVKRKHELKYAAQREEMINKNRVQNLYYTDYNDDNNGQNKY